MISLYDHPLSPCGQKVKIAHREKGLAFEPVSAGGLGAGGAAGEFALNFDRIVIARENELGVTHTHFPRTGFLVGAA